MRATLVPLLALLASCRGDETEANRKKCDALDPVACEKLCVSGKPTITDSCMTKGVALLGQQGAAPEAGRRILEAACDRGDPNGCGLLGFNYQGNKDHVRATALYEKGCAMKTTDAHACCEALAQNLVIGRGVKKDPARARSLFNDACKYAGYVSSCEQIKVLDKLGE